MILITGHRGFIGSLLFKKLTHQGYDVIGIDVKDGKNILSCDLPDVDVVYHLAAQTSVESSWGDPVHDSDNLKMTVRLVHAYPDAKIIYANSAASEGRDSPYGFSKSVSAEYIKKFHKNYVICTLPNVYGVGSKSVVDIFKERETVTIYGSGEQLRDYVHVEDIVKGFVKAKEWNRGEYELGSGIATSVVDLAEGKFVEYQPPRKEAMVSVLKNSTPNWKHEIEVKKYMQL